MTGEAEAAAALEEWGIDSAEVRLLAARDYIVEQEQIVTRQINALALVAELADIAEANALRRLGVDGDSWAASSRSAWGLPLTAADFLTARERLVRRYSGAARKRALEIMDDFIPEHFLGSGDGYGHA